MLAQIPHAHAEVVTSLTFSPHAANILCSTSGDDSVALWDVHNGGANVCRIQGHHRGPVNHALFLPSDANALLTAADDRTVALWDMRRVDRPVGQLTGFHDGVNKMLLLPGSAFPNCGLPRTELGDDHFVVSACDDGKVYVHALIPASQVGGTTVVTGTESSSSPAAPISPASPFGAAGSLPRQPQTSLPTANAIPSCGALVDCFWASTSTVNDLALLPNKQMIMTASEDGALRTWRLLFDPSASTEDRLLCSLDEFENPVNHVAFVPHGLMSLDAASPTSAGAGGQPQQQPSQRGGSTGHRDGERQVHESDDEAEAGAGGSATTAATTTYTAQDGVEDSEQAEQRRQQREEEERQGVRRWVLAACSEFVFGVDINVSTGEFGQGARSFVGHGDYVRGLEFTKQSTLLTVSDDSTAVEWNLTNSEPIRQVKLHDGFVMASAMNRAGDALATGTDKGEIRIWRLPFQTECLGTS